MKKSSHNIDTSRLIERIIAKQKLTKTDVGKAINRDKNTVASYMNNSSIQTGILLDLCHGLKHNFFRDIADQLPENFSRTNDVATPNDLLIVQLQEEIKTLTIENNLMKRALKIE